MRTKLMQFMMLSFIVYSLLTFVSIIVDFTLQPIKSYGINAVYALGPRPKPPWPRPRPPNPHPVPEPSTLVLLGTGLAVGGGVYAFIKYRKRNKK